jgi:hypothetical protein
MAPNAQCPRCGSYSTSRWRDYQGAFLNGLNVFFLGLLTLGLLWIITVPLYIARTQSDRYKYGWYCRVCSNEWLLKPEGTVDTPPLLSGPDVSKSTSKGSSAHDTSNSGLA